MLKLHLCFIHKNKQPILAYAPHILISKHECENIEQTLEQIKPCNKRVKMNILESFFIHILQKRNLFIKEQKINDPNPLFEFAQDVALHN
jgi:hypothetical protein